ncbi:BTAD domain-containing putative transcriptional regulator [Kribbella sp. DT2]|uniref:ATP-binding protein n=1 Tax=Kribbella sp. DT2 TaxID=3393427 RepID=UPI003CEFB492
MSTVHRGNHRLEVRVLGTVEIIPKPTSVPPFAAADLADHQAGTTAEDSTPPSGSVVSPLAAADPANNQAGPTAQGSAPASDSVVPPSAAPDPADHQAGPTAQDTAPAASTPDSAGIAVRQPLVRALAVRLALARGEAVSDEILVRDLWGDEELSRPSARLRVLASRLRGALGEESATLERTAAGFRLDAIAADLAEVERRVAELETARRTSRWPDVHTAAAAALDCWRGDPLEGLPDLPFVVAERQRLESLWVELRLDRVESGLEVGATGIDEELEQLIGKHPLHERPVRLAATAAVRAGDLQGALSRLSDLHERLADELGIDPSPETVALENQLRSGSALTPRFAQQPPITVSLPQAHKAFVGRDLEYADLLAQVSGESPYAGVVTLTGGAGVGKTRLAREVAWRESARGRRVGWVDLGPLGTSDSLVAVLAAILGVDGSSEDPLARCADELAGGLLVLDNAEHLVENTAALVEALLKFGEATSIIVTSQRLLRISAEEERRVGPLDAAAAAELFCDRSATDPGPEVDAICAAVDRLPLAIELAAGLTRTLSVAQLAERIDNRLRLLVRGPRDAGIRHTSLRAALDWSHELLETPERVALRRLAVFAGGFTAEAAHAVIADQPGLTPPSAFTGSRPATPSPFSPGTSAIPSALAERAVSEPAAPAERATSASTSAPAERATSASTSAPAKPAEQPAQQPAQQPASISPASATAPAAPFGNITAGAQADPRADSPAAASASPDAGSADARTPSATGLPDVLAPTDIAEILAELVERCVLTVEGGAEGIRFRLLETVRDYAFERLREAGEEEALRGRHVEWYGFFVRQFEGMGARNNTGVGAEEANLLAAVDWCLGEGTQAEKVSALVSPLWWYWPGRGLMLEASQWLERSLAELPPDSEEYAAGLSTLASLTRNRGLIPEARSIGERSLAAFRALGDEERVTIGLMSLTRTCLAQGDMVATLAHAEEVEQRCRADDRVTRRARASALNYMGLAHRNLRHAPQATALFEAARDHWQEIEDFGGVAIAMENLAIVARQTGQHELARTWAIESLRRARQSAFSMGMCGALESIACLAVAQGRPEEALQLLTATDTHRDKLGLPVQVPDELDDLASARATAYAALGRKAPHIADTARDLPLNTLADRYLT